MICKKCQVEKPKTEFYEYNGRRRNVCKECIKIYAKLRQEKTYIRRKLPVALRLAENSYKGFNDLGMVNMNCLRRWTKDAVMCHDRGCICGGCFFENFFAKSAVDEWNKRQICQMKASVLELVRVFGRPQKGVNYVEETFEEHQELDVFEECPF